MEMRGSCSVIHGDAAEILPLIASGSARLVLTSPPYNIGKAYERRAPLGDYVARQADVIAEAARILVPGGSLCWQVGNYVEDGEVVPLDSLLIPVIRSLGLKIRNRIVWSFGHGQHCRHRLSGRHETVVWATKGDGYLFNLDPIRIPQENPRKRHYRGARKGELSGHPLGKNPGDVWHIGNVKFNHPEKTAHPCQFPEALAERLVCALTEEGDLVIDPFAGSGTTGVVCQRLGRRSTLIEIIGGYADIARERVGGRA
jgi:adenine-specific DNA-methyltransferase